MTGINVSINGQEELRRTLLGFPNRLFKPVQALFRKTTFDIQRDMVARTSGSPLKRRTGALAKGFVTKVGGSNLQTLFGEVSNNVKYAPIHEYGGTIRPKSAKYLTIPTFFNKTGAGVQKRSVREVISQGGFFKRSEDFNGLYLFAKTGPRSIKPMFRLVKQVKIPARLQFKQTAEYHLGQLVSALRSLRV